MFRLIIGFILFFLSSYCYSLNIPDKFPAELIYKGQPIDPLCFEGGEKEIALDKCGIKMQADTKISGQDKDFLNKGYYGYDYQPTDDENIQGYSYYKVIGQTKDAFVIYHISSGGGSGVFTNIDLVKRQDNKIMIDSLQGGDRCNGGVDENVKLNNGIINYTVNITPFDYLQIAEQNPHNLQAYDDLAACAACCQGTATYQRDLSANGKEKLVTIDLGHNIQEADSNSQGKYQECFNKLLVAYMKQGKNSMNPLELKSFVNDFNAKCFKP